MKMELDIAKMKNDPLVLKMTNAIRDFVDAYPEVDTIVLMVEYLDESKGYYDRVELGRVHSTDMERRIVAVGRKLERQNAAFDKKRQKPEVVKNDQPDPPVAACCSAWRHRMTLAQPWWPSCTPTPMCSSPKEETD
jgi:hypothetical protein